MSSNATTETPTAGKDGQTLYYSSSSDKYFHGDPRDTRSELLGTAGEVVPPRNICDTHSVGNTPLATQRLYLIGFKAKRTETIAAASLYTGSTAAAATPTLIRFGVYSVAANGDLTLINSTANDTTLLAGTFTEYLKSFSASFSKVAGQEYALGLLIVSAGAMPTLRGRNVPGDGLTGAEHARLPIVCAKVDSQTDLPSSVSAGSVVSTGGAGGIIYWRLS